MHSTNAYTCHNQYVPARAVFQTGLYPHECGVMVIYGFHQHQARLTAKYRTLGHLCKDTDYQTAYFGKTHFGVRLANFGYGIDGDRYAMGNDEVKERMEIAPKPLRSDYRACDNAVEFA